MQIMTKICDVIQQKIQQSQINANSFLGRIFGGKSYADIKNINISIFGAGVVANELLRALENNGVRIDNFVVTNIHNTKVSQGVNVISIEEFIENFPDSYLLIGISNGEEEAIRILGSKGVSTDKIFRLNYDLSISSSIADPTQTMIGELRLVGQSQLNKQLKRDEKIIEDAYACLEDDYSKELFESKLAALTQFENINLLRDFLRDFSEPIKKFGQKPLIELGFSESFFYFNNEFNFLGEKKQSFVDIGAYDGCSTLAFTNKCRKDGVNYQVVAFEPDPNNFNQLVKNTEGDSNIEAINSGIWSKSTLLKFKSSDQFILKSSSEINEEGNIIVKVGRLDEFPLSRPVTIIKADPPGLEVALNVLEGCISTIKEDRPILIFPAYHTYDAIYKMPLAVKSLNLNYRIFLRHLSWSIGETDVFAIPA